MHPIQAIRTIALAGVAAITVSAASIADGHLAHAVANPDRPAAEIARDAGRKPAEVLAFLGVEPGMTVWDHASSSGYYTALLSGAVGAEGTVYAQNSEAFWPRLQETTEPRHKAMGNVETYIGQIRDFEGHEGEFDMVFTALIYHHMHYTDGTGDDGTPDASKVFYAKAMKMLKPGGVFAIIEHQAPDGTPRSMSANWHRASLQNAIDDLTAAGYEYLGASDVLANPDDPQNIPFRDLTSGRDSSQRFVAKFRKPRG